MNSRTTTRGVVSPGAVQYHPAPNAALLIDFDNVTMAIRSDLGKELKALLNSDVIRGKVAVQRAYADWRRYPQYIVPLAESSVDLIFAPAYGSSKKNATDLRMAIDAMELVFTRPEIGTYILMTGDSDFSSAVLKLKEYGKYVIGVGMRESSSDLLIQNCDEYYSYHSLSGLTREGEATVSAEDPWTLVKRAVQQMVKNGDVMRTDRLKQVMLELDPSFDEKKIGYSKFSRFVAEAASKDLLRLRRMENGQHEIIPEGQAAARPAARPAEITRPAPSEKAAAVEKPAERGQDAEREKIVERIVAEAEAEASSGRRGRGRGRGRDDRSRDGRGGVESPASPPETIAADAATEAAPQAEAPPARSEAVRGGEIVAPSGDLDAAYALLQEATRLLIERNGKSVRDGDVKRKMLEISTGFDESTLGFSKFTRFLRQAHDAEVIDLSRASGGNYDVSLPASGKKLSPPQRRAAPATKAASEAPADAATPAERKPEAGASTAAAKSAATPEAEVATKAAPPVGALRGRRGGRAGADGPPPILPGQVARPVASAGDGTAAGAAADEVTAEATAVSEEAAAEEKKGTRSRGRGGRRGKGRTAAAETPATDAATEAAAPDATPAAGKPEVTEPAGEPKPKATARGRRGRRAATDDGPPPILEGQVATAPVQTEARAPEKPAAKKAAPAERTSAAFSSERLGLPTAEAEVRTHLTSYRGIGAKTADALIEKFGPSVFEVLQERPAEIRELLGERRADALFEQWGPDYAAREAAAAPQKDEAPAKQPAKRGGSRKRTTAAKKDDAAAESRSKKSSGTSRAKGGRTTKKKEPASSQ